MMARGYLPAAVRCKQLERLVNESPGITMGKLCARSGISYQSCCAYMRRLVREQRVAALIEDPAMGAKAKQVFYPPDQGQRRKAA